MPKPIYAAPTLITSTALVIHPFDLKVKHKFWKCSPFYFSTAVVKSPFKFSCAVDSFEIKDVNENFIQAIFYKQKTFNTGRTALRFRLIDDSELLPFTCGHDIRNYLEETMICDLMFCSLTDIESRSTALSGPVLLTDDAFLTLRLIVEKLWHLGSEQEKKLVINRILLISISPVGYCHSENNIKFQLYYWAKVYSVAISNHLYNCFLILF